jgi:two-component system, sensor histidine kinase and response regulator
MTQATSISPSHRAATILIIDDIETNLNLLYVLVKALGHTPVLAKTGKDALLMLQKYQPDLILLDILMPDMDGYQVLSAIRQSIQFRRLPVVVISAITEMDSIVKCIQLGADDYLTKPLNKTILEARIQNCLERKYWNDQESNYLKKVDNRRILLEKMIVDKNNELAAVYQALNDINKTKNEFVRIISHELRTPLNSLMGSSKYLLSKGANQELRKESIELFTDALEQFKEIVEHTELLVQLELKNKKTQQNYAFIDTAMSIAIHRIRKFAHTREVTLPEIISNDFLTIGDEGLLAKGFECLLKLAIKFSSPNTVLSMDFNLVETSLKLSISATGWKIPSKYKNSFFDLFGVTETIIPGGDLGLIPPLLNSIFKCTNGSIEFQNLTPTGVCFTVTLPMISDISKSDCF